MVQVQTQKKHDIHAHMQTLIEENLHRVPGGWHLELKNRNLSPEEITVLVDKLNEDAPEKLVISLDLTHGLQAQDSFRHPIMQKLGELKHVVALNLSHNDINEEGQEYLKNMKQLISLDLSELSFNKINTKAISQLENLLLLNVHRTNISEKDLAPLAKLTKLKVLDVSWSAIRDDNDSMVAALAMKMPNLMSLSAGFNDTVGDSSKFKQHPALQAVSLGGDSEAASCARIYPIGNKKLHTQEDFNKIAAADIERAIEKAGSEHEGLAYQHGFSSRRQQGGLAGRIANILQEELMLDSKSKSLAAISQKLAGMANEFKPNEALYDDAYVAAFKGQVKTQIDALIQGAFANDLHQLATDIPDTAAKTTVSEAENTLLESIAVQIFEQLFPRTNQRQPQLKR